MVSSKIDGADGCFNDERLIDSPYGAGRRRDLHGGQRADACKDESSFHHDRAF